MIERTPAHNTGFASGGLACPALAGELCVPHLRDSVLVDPEIFRDAPKPARTQSPKTLTCEWRKPAW